MGGVIQDSGGNIIQLYVGSMGKSTKNAAEFGAMKLGLEILIHERMKNTIMEGESTLVINMVKRLQNGTRVGKFQRHWHLAHSLQKIQEHLQTVNTVELCFVRTSANGLVGKISNEGVSKDRPKLDTTWINIPNGQFKIDCIQLATKYCDGSLREEGHIEEGSARTSGRHEGPRQDMTAQHMTTNYNAGSEYTIGESMTTRSCQQ
jgi:ribonuclease HI